MREIVEVVKFTVSGLDVRLPEIIFDAIKQAAERDGISLQHEIEIMIRSGLMSKALDEAKIRYQNGKYGRRIQ